MYKSREKNNSKKNNEIKKSDERLRLPLSKQNKTNKITDVGPVTQDPA